MEHPESIEQRRPGSTESRPAEEIVGDAPTTPTQLEAGVPSRETLESGPQKLPPEWPLVPVPVPWLIQSSGVYVWRQSLHVREPVPIPVPRPIPQPDPWRAPPIPQPGPDGDAHEQALREAAGVFPIFSIREELRLDVDGRYPLMVASGTLHSGLTANLHWIANLANVGPNTYAGAIWYKDGNASSLPYTNVRIDVVKSVFSSYRRATVTFSGGGAAELVRTYNWTSGHHHPDEFEYDTVAGSTAVTSFNTGSHPNRPPGLPIETLTIETVYRRAGFDISMSGGSSTIPLPAAGADALWSDMEMHDAMQVYWSRVAAKPQWSVWTLFAGQHVAVPSRGITPTNLGGIMFDDIGPNHRQGTAIFNASFINEPPAGDPDPAAAVARMKFWTAVHEMGHTFNLAHSWQKSLGNPWIPLPDEPEARSFMNYPYKVHGGESAFFADFEYRFSDGELLFMRHAPHRFVQHGNADWFENHGFQEANAARSPSMTLELRVHRTLDYFEFLEPVTIELKLTNVTKQPMIVDELLLCDTANMTVIVKKQGKPARQWSPYARYCVRGDKKVLGPQESPGSREWPGSRKSLYGSLFVAAGLNGWDLSEPGLYDVQVVLHMEHEDIISNSLRIRVAPPRGYDEEFIAQDFFSEDVGRALEMNGTRALASANDVLAEVAERCADRRVATHARLALGNPLMRRYKLLDVKGTPEATNGHPRAEKAVKVLARQPEEARERISKALLDTPDDAADTLGHIDYHEMVSRYAEFLAEAGAPKEAAEGVQKAENTLRARGVLPIVVDQLAEQRKSYGDEGSGR